MNVICFSIRFYPSRTTQFKMKLWEIKSSIHPILVIQATRDNFCIKITIYIETLSMTFAQERKYKQENRKKRLFWD